MANRYFSNYAQKGNELDQLRSQQNSFKSMDDEFDQIEHDMKELLDSLDVSQPAPKRDQYFPQGHIYHRREPSFSYTNVNQDPRPQKKPVRERVIGNKSSHRNRGVRPTSRSVSSIGFYPESKNEEGRYQEHSLDQLTEFQRRLELFGLDDFSTTSNSSFKRSGSIRSKSDLYSELQDSRYSEMGPGGETGYASEENTENSEFQLNSTSSAVSNSKSFTVKDIKRMNKNSKLMKQEMLQRESLRSSQSRLGGSKNSLLTNSTVDLPHFGQSDRSTIVSDNFSLVGSVHEDNASKTSSNSSLHSNAASILNVAGSRYTPKVDSRKSSAKKRSSSTGFLAGLRVPGVRRDSEGVFCVVCREPIVEFERAGKNKQEKWVHQDCLDTICPVCSQVVFPVEEMCVGNQSYHRWCCKCNRCGRTLTTNTANTFRPEVNGSKNLLCDFCLGRETKRTLTSPAPQGAPPSDQIWYQRQRGSTPALNRQQSHGEGSVLIAKLPVYQSMPFSTDTPPNRRSLGSVFQADVDTFNPNISPDVGQRFSSRSTSNLGSNQIPQQLNPRRAQNVGSSHGNRDTQCMNICCVCRQEIVWDQSRDLLRENELAHWTCIKDVCPICWDRVHQFEGWSSHGRMYHKRCFKCALCGAAIAKGNETVKKDRSAVRRLYHHYCITTSVLKNWV